MTTDPAKPAPAAAAPAEPREIRIKRLRMRAWRRGTREMDLILGPYADACLAGLDPAALVAFEALLDENDQDLYVWVSRPETRPDRHAGALTAVAAHALARPVGPGRGEGG